MSRVVWFFFLELLGQKFLIVLNSITCSITLSLASLGYFDLYIFSHWSQLIYKIKLILYSNTFLEILRNALKIFKQIQGYHFDFLIKFKKILLTHFQKNFFFNIFGIKILKNLFNNHTHHWKNFSLRIFFHKRV